MQRKDYYGILGVARGADENEIKIAYRKLALRNHPDTNRDDPQAEERFKEINEAYDILSHRDKRNRYDLGRDPLAEGSPFRRYPFNPWGDPFEAAFCSGFRCRGGGFGRGFGWRRRFFQGAGAGTAGFVSDRRDLPLHDLPVTSKEAEQGAKRDIRLHTDGDIRVFTVSIPPGVENGNLLNFKCHLGHGQEIKLLFRVRIAE